MKKQRTVKKYCGDHFRYVKRETADHAMIDMSVEHNQKALSVYRCKICRDFHVGHTPWPVRARFGLDVQ